MMTPYSRPLTLEHVERYLNFASANIEEVIARKQIEGVAGLWKILGDHRHAYLADEVGMGKTYQALGVAVLTWMAKPSARILVIAPNKVVQKNWVDEFKNFVRHNVKATCDRVKDPFTANSPYEVLSHDNLARFTDALLHDLPGLHIVRLTSFSHLAGSLGLASASTEAPLTYADIEAHLGRRGIFGRVPPGREEMELTSSLQTNVASAMILGEVLPRFDLVVIDEAHLLRKRGANIKTNVLSYMLGMRPPAMKAPIEAYRDDAALPPPTLFLSATPAHRSEQDIYAQLAYVESEASALENARPQARQKFIEDRFVRRLRLFCNHSKYGYRDDNFEEARAIRAPGSDQQSPSLLEELFFIASQQAVEEALREKSGGLGATVKFGFLECFESYEVSASDALDSEQDEAEAGSHYDITDEKFAPDRSALEELVRAYQACTDGSPPPHPKMGLIEEDFRAQLRADIPEKLLIFVRRRASVFEITRRICRIYDDHMLENLGEVLGQELASVEALQRVANNYLGRGDDEDIPDDEVIQEVSEAMRSRALEVFATRSKDAQASNRFRDRFRAGGSLRGVLEENLLRVVHRAHHLGDAPSEALSYEDFLDVILDDHVRAALSRELTTGSFWNKTRLHTARAAYHVHVRVLREAKKHSRYKRLAGRLLKLLETDPNPPAIDLDKEVASERDDTLDRVLLRRSVWDVIADEWDERVEDADARDVGDMLRVEPTASREVLRQRAFVRNVWDKNLRIGEGIFDLFCAYVGESESLEGNERLDRDKMSVRLAHLLLTGPRREAPRVLVWRMAEFSRMLTHMEPLLNSTLDSKQRLWAETNWSAFDQQEPILGVMGGSSSRDRAITQFNTPFFPDIIVCTDIFREGVNLHRCCRRVWHYGMSATPGDIEQRTGRVDRYFSVVHRALIEDDVTPARRGRLDVGFPYLGQSIDEDQLARAIANRLSVQPLLDRGTAEINVSDTLDLSVQAPSLRELRERLGAERSREHVNAPFEPRYARGEYADPFSSEVADELCVERARDRFEELLESLDGERHHMTDSSQGGLTARAGSVRLSTRPVVGAWSHVLELEAHLSAKGEHRAMLDRCFPESTLEVISTSNGESLWDTRLVSTIPFELSDLVANDARFDDLKMRVRSEIGHVTRVAMTLEEGLCERVVCEPGLFEPVVQEVEQLDALVSNLRGAPARAHRGSLTADILGRRQGVFISPLKSPRAGRTHLVRSIVSNGSPTRNVYESVSLPAGATFRRITSDDRELIVLQCAIDHAWSRAHLEDVLTRIARAADICEWHAGEGQDVF